MKSRSGLENQPQDLGDLLILSERVPFLDHLLDKAHRAMMRVEGVPVPRELTAEQRLRNYLDIDTSPDIIAFESFLMRGVEEVLAIPP